MGSSACCCNSLDSGAHAVNNASAPVAPKQSHQTRSEPQRIVASSDDEIRVEEGRFLPARSGLKRFMLVLDRNPSDFSFGMEVKVRKIRHRTGQVSILQVQKVEERTRSYASMSDSDSSFLAPGDEILSVNGVCSSGYDMMHVCIESMHVEMVVERPDPQ